MLSFLIKNILGLIVNSVQVWGAIMLKWQNPLLTLGERCVIFSENEMNKGVKESYPGSYTSNRIKQYFSICTRLIKGKEIPLPLIKGNWCSAGVSFALYESLLPGELMPHGYRVGVVEVVSDLKKAGRWHTKKDVQEGKYKIKIGDPVIFDRSKPGKPETNWWRHIGLVYNVSKDKFDCISGNSYGKWRISKHKLTQSTLIGFGEYPGIDYHPTGIREDDGIDWSEIDFKDLAPLEDTGKNLEEWKLYSIFNKVFNK